MSSISCFKILNLRQTKDEARRLRHEHPHKLNLNERKIYKEFVPLKQVDKLDLTSDEEQRQKLFANFKGATAY